MRRVLTLTVLLVFSLCAQSTNASLTGRVTDPSKGLIAGATVTAIKDGTNVHYEATTDVSGEYSLANLPAGAYRIEVEKTGFKKLIKPDDFTVDGVSANFGVTG
jgi:Carboxypeptidase regulatory-like domain